MIPCNRNRGLSFQKPLEKKNNVAATPNELYIQNYTNVLTYSKFPVILCGFMREKPRSFNYNKFGENATPASFVELHCWAAAKDR